MKKSKGLHSLGHFLQFSVIKCDVSATLG